MPFRPVDFMIFETLGIDNPLFGSCCCATGLIQLQLEKRNTIGMGL